MSVIGDLKRYYITTSIPYVNAVPHIGHALEFVQTDAFARYHRLTGDDTYFLSGSDENSLTNVLAAEREGIPVIDLVTRNAQAFIDVLQLLGASNDDFIRTAIEPRHIAGAQKLWEACAAKGDIYKKHYQGLYCVRCEQFYAPEELDNGLCPEHHIPPEPVEEENYFFRLSRYQDQLLALIDSGELRIIPDTRRNEVRSFVARGLEDFSLSRTRERAHGWGIGVPGDPDQVMYVWFDALSNYITALGYAEDAPLYQHYWLENPQRVHAIGKGIVRFHAVYWPAMLLSAGVPLPHTVFVHGYLTIGGQKISKSLGNVVNPVDVVERYGAEAVRYWLLREVPATGDADYTDEKLERRYNADLANDLGNLLNRTISMIQRYRAGSIPSLSDAAPSLREDAGDIFPRIRRAMAVDYDPQAALEAIWEIVVRANRYVEEMAPWTLSKAERGGDVESGEKLNATLANLAEALRVVANALQPFLPLTAARMAEQLGVALEPSLEEALRWGGLPDGSSVDKPVPIFPKLEAPVAER